MSDIKPLRLCKNCGYLGVEGYEYPESYCMAGVSENDPLCVGDGCIYNNRQLRIKAEWRNNAYRAQYDSIEEWIKNGGLDDLFESEE